MKEQNITLGTKKGYQSSFPHWNLCHEFSTAGVKGERMNQLVSNSWIEPVFSSAAAKWRNTDKALLSFENINLRCKHFNTNENCFKITNKIRASERFAAYIGLPMWQEGSATSTATQKILFWQIILKTKLTKLKNHTNGRMMSGTMKKFRITSIGKPKRRKQQANNVCLNLLKITRNNLLPCHALMYLKINPMMIYFSDKENFEALD